MIKSQIKLSAFIYFQLVLLTLSFKGFIQFQSSFLSLYIRKLQWGYWLVRVGFGQFYLVLVSFGYSLVGQGWLVRFGYSLVGQFWLFFGWLGLVAFTYFQLVLLTLSFKGFIFTYFYLVLVGQGCQVVGLVGLLGLVCWVY